MKLSTRASQALLAALTRRQLSQQVQAEFAKTAGLSRHVVGLALQELEQAGLISSIAQGVKDGQVSLVGEPVLADQRSGDALQMESLESQSPPGEELGDTEETDPLEQCRLADISGDRKEKIAALMVVWEEAFPPIEDDYYPLSDSFAKWLTRDGRSAERAGDVIQRVGQRGMHIEYPVSYVRAAVELDEERRGKQPGGDITDDLRALTRLGMEQYG